MLFNSFEFLIFFTSVFLFYLFLKDSQKLKLLLVASYFFYMFWIPAYGLLILISTVIDYFCALKIEKETGSRRKGYLLLSLVSNLGMLFFFKYLYFASSSLQSLLDYWWPASHGGASLFQIPLWKIVLPVGISFYTFQTLSYTIDVYLKKCVVERNFFLFALYVSFFPQLVAGPIERSTHLLPQFRQPKPFQVDQVSDGLKLMAWGFFKKLMIADRVAPYVHLVYESPWNYQGATFLIATYLFALQIYCDFSGYSDIAVGCAKVFGYDLMENFKRPYFARTIPEFWRRWHISLSTWFRDYLYIPLGGSRVSSSLILYRNLWIVFLVSGIWHGANFTFMLWGALHAFYQCVYLWIPKKKATPNRIATPPQKTSLIQRLFTLFQILLTFHLVCIAWVFFRAKHVGDAYYILREILSFSWNFQEIISPLGKVECFYSVLFIAFLFGIETLQECGIVIRHALKRLPIYLRWPLYMAFLTSILMFACFEKQEFIYFQF